MKPVLKLLHVYDKKKGKWVPKVPPKRINKVT